MAASSDTINVEILGSKLKLRAGDNPESVKRAAATVKETVEALAKNAPTAPSLQVVLLAAINLADELFQAQQNQSMLEEAVQKANEIISKAETV